MEKLESRSLSTESGDNLQGPSSVYVLNIKTKLRSLRSVFLVFLQILIEPRLGVSLNSRRGISNNFFGEGKRSALDKRMVNSWGSSLHSGVGGRSLSAKE